MNLAYTCYLKQKGTPPTMNAVEDACRKHKEDCQLRLARIQNGTHPDYQNGHPKDAEKGRK
jgi:hypothetical protein